MPITFGYRFGPDSTISAGPCMMCEKRDLARPVAKAAQVVQVKVLQLIGPDNAFS